jgi:signal transduction histidine kinase
MLSSADTAPVAHSESSRSADSRGLDAVQRRGNFLSQLPADRSDQRIALIVVGLSALIFLALAPFAKLPLAPVPAFIPIYQSALIISDLVTAVLLLGQFAILRSRALLVLASAYLFTALITVSHTLSFPGLVAPGGWLGAGPQTTAWLYMFWHGVFPLLVVVYARLGDARLEGGSVRHAITLSVGAVAGLVLALTLLATVGRELLPAIMTGNRYTTAMIFVVGGVWLLSLVALLVLWRQRRRSILDVWLMVVMCAWLFDIALAAVLNAGRFDLGFYAGRVYGLLAATFVLMVLLLESSALGAGNVGAGEAAAAAGGRDRRAPRLAYAAIGVFLLVLVAIATQTYLSVREELTSVVTTRRLALAQVAAVTQSERLDRVADVAVSLATRVRFAELIAAGEWDAAIQILRGVPREFAFVDRVAVFDAGGTLKADTGLERVSGRNFADRDWYQGLQRSGGKPYVSSMYRRAASPQIDLFAIAAPIVDREGRRTGILLLHVKIDAFFSWTTELDFGPGGALLVIDREGNEAFHSGVPKRDGIVSLAAHPVAAKLMQGVSGTEVARDAAGMQNLYAFVPERHGWGVVAVQPAAAAFAEREHQLMRVLIGSGVILFFFLSSAGLAAHVAAQRRRSERRFRERLRVLHGIDRAVIGGRPADEIAAAVIQPLRELLDVPRAIVNKIDLAARQVEWIAAAGRRRTHIGPGVRYSLDLMGDVEALRRGEIQIVDTHKVPGGPDADALLASGVAHYMVVPMIAGGELIGAISFGGEKNEFHGEQVHIAREVAAQLSIAMTMSRLVATVRQHASELETRVLERTAELEAVNKELSAFSYSVSHDLRAPLRAVDGYARMLEEDYAARLDDEGRRLLGVVRDSAGRMGHLIDDLLAFSRLSRQPIARQTVDSASLVREVVSEVRGDSKTSVEVGELPPAQGDRALLKQVWVNLVSNAIKYSSKRDAARVEIGGQVEGEENIYWVRDNGAGFDMRYATKLFGVFQRLHSQEEFSGTGVGLAIVQRVVTRHGGRVWAEGKPGEGACFSFSLPREHR